MSTGVLKKWPARKVSRTVFYALLAVVAVVFGLFYTVGYTRPFEDNPEYNAPLLSGLVVAFTLFFVAAAAVVLLAALFVSARRRRRGSVGVVGMRPSRVAMAVAAATLLTLAVTFALGSSSAIVVNGSDYTDVFWLKAADMFVYTIAAMFLFAVAAVAFGKMSGHRGRKEAAVRGSTEVLPEAVTSAGQESREPERGGNAAGNETD